MINTYYIHIDKGQRQIQVHKKQYISVNDLLFKVFVNVLHQNYTVHNLDDFVCKWGLYLYFRA